VIWSARLSRGLPPTAVKFSWSVFPGNAPGHENQTVGLRLTSVSSTAHTWPSRLKVRGGSQLIAPPRLAKRLAWSHAAPDHETHVVPVLVGHDPPAVVLRLVDAAAAMERLHKPRVNPSAAARMKKARSGTAPFGLCTTDGLVAN
jgi:hypothetical protein